MRTIRNIYISSIYQDAGKTTIALGLYKVFRERKLRTAFLKPVGQQTVPVGDRQIDKDSYLIGEVYKCRNLLPYMSPVTLGHGYTEKYIFNPQKDSQREDVQRSFDILTKGRDAIIVEGTGHAGVGSVVDLSNADVAKMLGSRVIMVSEGGIGRSIDEIMLNKALFDLKQVEVLGVIINKVMPEKYDRIKKALTQGLSHNGIRLLGVIPMDPLLSYPTVGQVMANLKLKLLCGKVSLRRHVRNTIVAAMEPYNMVKYIKNGTLVLTSGDRIDNIMAAVSSHLVSEGERTHVAGILLSGGILPHPHIIELLRRSRIPVLGTDDDTYTVAGKIENLICKIQKTDKDKIHEACELVKKYVDVDTLLAQS